MAGYTLKITIEGTSPSVWRRVMIPENITFFTLHEIIQRIFDWNGEHLHEFRTNSGVRIGMDDEDSRADQYAESDTGVNEFLENSKWIRYTYDFGNEWRHRIVLEKKDPSYGVPFAMVIDYRGDNFIEDFVSDGEWDYGRFPFAPEAANIRLGALDYRFKGQPSEDIFSTADDFPEGEWKDQIGLEEFLDMLIPYVQENERVEALYKKVQSFDSTADGVRKRQISSLERMIDSVWDFFDEWINETEENPSKDSNFHMKFAVPEVSMRDALLLASKKELGDYCKYFGIPVGKKARKIDMAGLLSQMFLDDPSNFCYVFSEKNMSELLGIREQQLRNGGKAGREYVEASMNSISLALSLGLMQAGVTRQGESRTLTFRWVKEADDVISGLRALHWKKRTREIADVKSKILNILELYGILDFDYLFEKLREWYRIRLFKPEVEKIIYAGLRLPDRVMTMTSAIDGKRYILNNMLDFQICTAQMYEYASDSDWYPFTFSDQKKMNEGFSALYPCWSELEKLFDTYMEIPDSEMEDLLDECYLNVWEGAASTEMIREIADELPVDSHSFFCYLWEKMMVCCMDTGLPMLRGYSRRKFAEARKLPVYLYQLFDERELETWVKRDTSLWRMPLDVQMQLFKAWELPDTGAAVSAIRSVGKQVCEDNYEIRFMMGDLYFEAGEMKKAEEILSPLQRELGSRDPYIKGMLRRIRDTKKESEREAIEDSIFETMFTPPTDISTYRRETPKIGRNDPCPCGSGKKYKKCCGRNLNTEKSV